MNRAEILLVQFSRSVVSDSLQPHGLQHLRSPCPSLIPGVYSNLCPLSQWCHPTMSSSVVPFFFRLQSFLASDLFRWVSSSHQMAKELEFRLLGVCRSQTLHSLTRCLPVPCARVHVCVCVFLLDYQSDRTRAEAQGEAPWGTARLNSIWCVWLHIK